MKEIAKATDWAAIGKENQNKYEKMILGWNNTVMHYSEGRLDFPGLVEVYTDDWGVRITLNSDHFHRPITLSGAWEILTLGEDYIHAAYVNWTLRKIVRLSERGSA